MAKRPAPVQVGDDLRARAVRPRGVRGPDDGRWYWRGERSRVVVWTGWASRDEVLLALAKVLIDPGPVRSHPEDLRTISALLEAWYETTIVDRSDRSDRTRAAYRGAIHRLSPRLGGTRIDRLGRATIDAWVADRQRAGHAPQTITLDLQVLGTAWRWGRQVGACPDRALHRPRLRAAPCRTRQTPTLGQLARVVSVLEASAPAWVAITVRLAAATGARIGEIASLTWDQIDLSEGVIRLQGKTGGRVVPIRAELVALLERLPRTRRWVLGRSPSTVRGIGVFLDAACAEADVPRFTPHGLRRLAVDTLARAGVDVATAADLLGHSPAVMLQHYRQVGAGERRAAAASLGQLPRGELVDARHRFASQVGHDE